MASDLEIGLNNLLGKNERYTKLWRYYDGPQPLVYSTKKLRDAFKDIKARFDENVVSLVTDTLLDRLDLKDIKIGKETNPIFDEWLRSVEIESLVDDVHLSAFVTGEAFVIFDIDDESYDEDFLVPCYHDSRQVAAIYDYDQPWVMQFAAKYWHRSYGEPVFLNLYYPDRIEGYKTRKPVDSYDDLRRLEAKDFDPYDENSTPTPFDNKQIPVIHYRRQKRAIVPGFEKVIYLQDAINKLFNDMMVTSEFNAFKQRVIISASDPGNMLNAPNRNWWIPSATEGQQPTQVIEIGGSDVSNFLNAIDSLVEKVAMITGTPKHFLYKQAGDPSGEALIAMEAPQVKRAKQEIQRLTPSWESFAEFALDYLGIDYDSKEVTVTYADPETVQPRTRSEIRTLDRQAGIPLATIVRREGWTEQETADLEADIAAEEKRNAQTMADQLLAAERRNDAGNPANNA